MTLAEILQWLALHNWVLSILGLPPTTLGVDMDWALKLLLYLYILRVLDSCKTSDEKLSILISFAKEAVDRVCLLAVIHRHFLTLL
jgi:hypothetical protein